MRGDVSGIDPDLRGILSLVSMGEIADAFELLSMVGKRDPMHPALADLAAILAERQGDLRGAHRNLFRALRLHRRGPVPQAPLMQAVDPETIRNPRSGAYRGTLQAGPPPARIMIDLYRTMLTKDRPVRIRVPALTRIGQLYEALGEEGRALECFETARTGVPGFGAADTGRALVLLRRDAHRACTAARRPPGAQIVAKSDIGATGRFGNQILQYLYLRAYARRHGLTACAPDWIGRYLYDLDDPFIETAVPERKVEGAGGEALLGSGKPAPAGIDILGFCQIHTSAYETEREWLQSLFEPRENWRDALDAALGAVRGDKSTLVAVHIRRGDVAGREPDILPAIERWLSELWPTLDRPRLYVATEDMAESRARLAAFAPITADRLPPPPAGVEFLFDHHILRQADIVAISPGTFSFSAALLNRGARGSWRPDLKAGQMVPFDPWNDQPGAPPGKLVKVDPSAYRADGSIVISVNGTKAGR